MRRSVVTMLYIVEHITTGFRGNCITEKNVKVRKGGTTGEAFIKKKTKQTGSS